MCEYNLESWHILLMPHIHEKIDFTVDVFVVYKSRVLIRKHDKYDKWLAVGEHIEEEGISESIKFYEIKALEKLSG
jgi:hypothetical protein